MPVISVKVSNKTKKEMDKLKSKVEWPSEIRGFIDGRLIQAKHKDSIERVERILPKVKRGTASRFVREDRDRGH